MHKDIRNWLVAQRKNAGLSQCDIAKQLSIAQSYYSRIENGKNQRDMTYSMIEKLAHALGVTVQEIIDAEKNRHKLA